MKQKQFSLTFFFVGVLLFPLVTNAATYSLYRYKENAGDSLLISEGTTENMQNFLCSIQLMNCSLTASTTLANPYPAAFDPSITNSFPAPTGIYTVLEKIIKQNGILKQYMLTSSADSGQSLVVLPISENIDRVIYTDGTNTKAVFISTPDKDKQKIIIFYDLVANKEIGRVTTTDTITNALYSPDGTTFAYYVPAETNTAKTKKYVLLRLENGIVKNFTYTYDVEKEWELLTDANRLHSFSSDGTVYAYLEDSKNFTRPRVITSLANGFDASMDLSWPDLGVVADVFLSSNSTLLVVANSQSRPYDWSLYQIDIASGIHEEVVKDISILYEMKKMPNGRMLFPVLDHANLQPVLYDPITKTTQSFSGLNWNTQPYNHKKSAVTFANNAHGIFITAENKKSIAALPLVVWLHGGPFRQTAKDFHSYPSYATYDWMLDEVVAGGANVLKLDYPGSYGYGNAYAYSLLGKDGSVDSKSAMDNIKELRKLKKLTGKVYVIGNSYGGYLAAKLITDYPSDITEAIAVNGVYEWRTLLNYLHTSIFNIHFDGLFDPEHTTTYDASSITQRLDRLTSKNKIVVAVSTEDKTINPDQAYTFVELLKSKKKNVEQLLLLGDDHILKKKESNDLLCKKVFTELKLKLPSGGCSL